MSERPLSDRAVISARPRVEVDGASNARVQGLLQTLEVVEREGGLSTLELRVSNIASTDDGSSELAFEDDTVLRLGASLEVFVGVRDDQVSVFRGVVTGLEAEWPPEGPPELVVLAEDAFQQARMARRTRLHKDASIGRLAEDIASRVGLRADVSGFSGGIGDRMQLNESDLAFLRRLLRERDGDLQVVDGKLNVAPRDAIRRSTVTVALRSQLLRVRAIADLAHQATSVGMAGFDVGQGRHFTRESTGDRLGPGSGRSGAEILRDALGERAEHLAHRSALDGEEAQALVDAAFDQAARSFVCLEGTLEGNSGVRLGTHLTVEGLGARFDNTYYVREVRHRYDLERGFETDFEAECAWLGAP